MKSKFAYFRPETLPQALEFLEANSQDAGVLAGGTDLMISVRNGEFRGKHVVDVSRLAELRHVGTVDDGLFIGAAVPYVELLSHASVKELAPVLASACRHVGSAQIRNVGTLGGNVANASPAADSVPALLAHNAAVIIRSNSEERRAPLSSVIVGPYRTSLRPGELIVGFLLEGLPCHCFSFNRIARRKALSIARINAAATALFEADGTMRDVRLAVGSATPTACRMTDAEAELVGELPDLTVFRAAATRVSEEMVRQSGIRPTTEYKRPAVEGLVLKVLMELVAPHA